MEDVGTDLFKLCKANDSFHQEWRASRATRLRFYRDIVESALNMVFVHSCCHNDCRLPNMAYSVNSKTPSFCLVDFDLVDMDIHVPNRASLFSPRLSKLNPPLARLAVYTVAQLAMAIFMLDIDHGALVGLLASNVKEAEVWSTRRDPSCAMDAAFDRWVESKGGEVKAFVAAVRRYSQGSGECRHLAPQDSYFKLAQAMLGIDA
jgi:hypothetical protein